MSRYAVTREIHAKPQVIWDLLTDAPAYPNWNPAVLAIAGRIAPGERIELTSVVNPKRPFKLEVTEFNPPHIMVWADGMPLGLFKGVRTYRLTPQLNGPTAFSMEEVLSGLLEPMISKSIPDMTESFELFADGLKQAAEST
jgi:uncharacterized protein YndB with AHSA1/START domain